MLLRDTFAIAYVFQSFNWHAVYSFKILINTTYIFLILYIKQQIFIYCAYTYLKVIVASQQSGVLGLTSLAVQNYTTG